MPSLRSQVEARPSAALVELADADRRYPEGRTDERSLLRMRSFVNLNDIVAARLEAELFFRRFPASPWAGDVVQLTGVRPRPGPPWQR